ncbi:MAG: hypothetical protein K2X39_09410, partial [Silvanigrellaceae bacterium]|nr:hypothetical protein [Silvanigrellaceae bacterium]
ANGLEKTEVTLEDSALEDLIRYYTREAGVRNLEREISTICRKIAKNLLSDIENNKNTSVAKKSRKETVPEESPVIVTLKGKIPPINSALVEKYLGPKKFSIGEKEKSSEIGICQGLAYTEVGGDLLVVEVAVMPGKGNLKITGKLGEVMQESAQAALTYVRSRAAFLGLEEDFYSKIDIHVHFPEGAIPKDGPSAGITMVTALVSALTKRPVSRDVAMTGEITLRGRVLPIGGLKEKLLAAHRGQVFKIIIPSENEKDLHEIPKNVREKLQIITASHMDTVLLHALAWGQNDFLENRLKDSQTLLPTSDIHKGGQQIHH